MSGGYAGLFALNPLSYRVDTDESPDSDCARLVELVHASGVLESPSRKPEPGTSGQPDVYKYELSIADGGAPRTFFFDDANASADVHMLLQYLQVRAIQHRMNDG